MFLRWAMTDDAPAYGGWGNGAPMRVSAVGWLATADDVRSIARQQAAVSHDHADAISALVPGGSIFPRWARSSLLWR
jgi:ADP-ribosyl-[dinitrogen reductase] hydrolase